MVLDCCCCWTPWQLRYTDVYGHWKRVGGSRALHPPLQDQNKWKRSARHLLSAADVIAAANFSSQHKKTRKCWDGDFSFFPSTLAAGMCPAPPPPFRRRRLKRERQGRADKSHGNCWAKSKRGNGRKEGWRSFFFWESKKRRRRARSCTSIDSVVVAVFLAFSLSAVSWFGPGHVGASKDQSIDYSSDAPPKKTAARHLFLHCIALTKKMSTKCAAGPRRSAFRRWKILPIHHKVALNRNRFPPNGHLVREEVGSRDENINHRVLLFQIKKKEKEMARWIDENGQRIFYRLGRHPPNRPSTNWTGPAKDQVLFGNKNKKTKESRGIRKCSVRRPITGTRPEMP